MCCKYECCWDYYIDLNQLGVNFQLPDIDYEKIATEEAERYARAAGYNHHRSEYENLLYCL